MKHCAHRVEGAFISGMPSNKQRVWRRNLEPADQRYRAKTDGRGPAAARNTGAALATGDLLLFLNGDVTIGPDYVSRLLTLMDENDLDAAAGRAKERR